ncbi:hypothetical protein [Phenylobacterium aquaticum]|uniref:hypothetical protein n=1 Tax=Phenylobacterium aquaticum TaxID=1763816 RepID=UPI001F5CC27E|nr:hypothetical protein [Phenylobacterium aquaticum]MCI3132688.1 hypothetical protein [Phenylobacterium aquaticum]
MRRMRQLAKFGIEIRETDFVLRLTDDNGEVTEFSSSAEQLDQMIDVFNDLMAEDEEDD